MTDAKHDENPKQIKPFGQWPSPLSPSAMASQLRLSEVAWGQDEALVWLEGRGGQGVIVVSRPGDAPRDLYVTHSARGGVGYGGGELCVAGERVCFAGADGRLYQAHLDHGDPAPLTTPHGRVASPRYDPSGAWIVYVHTDGHHDTLAIIDAKGARWPRKIVEGADFYMQPTWSSSGAMLAYVAWDHPQMPWDGTRLEVVHVTDAGPEGLSVSAPEVLAGGPREAIQQPEFSPDGRYLAYLSDASGWTHLMVRELATGQVRQLTQGEADHGGPAWVQGQRFYAWSADSASLLALRAQRGVTQLTRVSLEGEQEVVPGLEDYTTLAQLACSPQGQVALIASSGTIPPRVICWDPTTQTSRVARYSSPEREAASALSRPEAVSWRGEDGELVHGIFYPPASARYRGEGAAPAIVIIHGGPTAHRMMGWDSRDQLFATRGYAVLEVNYRGSTGYGRAYREALRGQWGVLDVADAVSAAKFLGSRDDVDGERVAILGGSAGGYTVLRALTAHPGVFAAGVSLYGIADLFALAASTHKFESHYNDSLLGPLPDSRDLYAERSPIRHVDRLSDPLAVFQGAEDEVVPPEQAELIVAALRERGIPHIYHLYEGEGHGWRKPETIRHFYEATLAFLSEHLS